MEKKYKKLKKEEDTIIPKLNNGIIIIYSLARISSTVTVDGGHY